MICPEFATPKYLFFADGVFPLVYYSHLTSIIVSLLIGFFVYFKNRRLLLAKLLFWIAITFSIWTVLSLITWTNNSSGIIMLDWSMDGIVYLLLCILVIYFFYVFIENKDISFNKKILFGLILLPIILFTPTKYNLSGFNLTLCGSAGFEGQYFTSYYYGLGFIIFLWILILSFLRYKKANKEFKKPLLIMTIGVELFLLTFFIAGFLASYLVDKGLTNDFQLDQYGLFGMTVFMAFLAYLIVKFKAFNIKLLGAQALVIFLVILVGSLLFVGDIYYIRIITGITLLITMGVGLALIQSVKAEVKRKEELQLMSEKLSQANDQLRKLDNAKSEFISIASHQLRTPLTVIKGFVSLILEGTYGEVLPQVREALNKVYLSGERLINLVENLLSISRIESGRMEYQLNPTRLEGTLKELFDNFTILAINKGVKLEMKLPKDPLPEVMADESKIREVISNFIDNALKYTNKGKITVRVEQIPNTEQETSSKIQDTNSKIQETSSKEQETNSKIQDTSDIQETSSKEQETNFKIQDTSDMQETSSKEQETNFKIQDTNRAVRITVSDTGIGIPATELPYLFVKFSRGKDTGRLNVSGTGLGLYVAKNIVEAHHGRVWAESDGDGLGSRFIMELPINSIE